VINDKLIVRQLGERDYVPVWQEMQAFTLAREASSADEVWLVQHPAVFTQGLNGKPEHVINPGDIPLVQVDRGGQVTYHGPGQIVAYTLIDINRRGWGVRQLVTAIENTVIALLGDYGLDAYARSDAPGVYVSLEQQDAKLASLGLRIKRGKSYHGLSLNVDMDLSPFACIHPCGYEGLKVTQLSDLAEYESLDKVALRLITHFQQYLGYQDVIVK
jgi:lipoyl(octanoyl) transferase